jgi:hypothetical protein
MPTRSIKTVLTTVVAFLALAATSWAYFASTGTGTGTGAATANRTVTVGLGAAPSSTLIPTGTPTGTLSVSLTNATGVPLKVTSLELDTTLGVNNSGYSQRAIDCKITFTTQSLASKLDGGMLPVGKTDLLLTKSVTMGTDAPADCNTSNFVIHVRTA